MATYWGDFSGGQNIDMIWNSYNSLGAPVTRSSQGTIWVSRDNSSTTTCVGITDTKDFIYTGDQLVRVSTNSATAYYTGGHNYFVHVSGDTIDGQFFAGCVAAFSIGNRRDSICTYGELLSAPVADGPTREQMLQWTYQVSRTSLSQTSTQGVLSSSNKSSIATTTISDDGTTYKRGTWA
jgi:hypothetical protein